MRLGRLHHEGVADRYQNDREGNEPAQFDTGTWRVEEDRLCRDWQKTTPLHACWSAVVEGSHIRFFDRDGLMVIAARIESD